jgi:DNA modification methylase
LIAAEEIGRVCVGVDLDARYVDVTIRRWENLTGREAVHVQSGETFRARAQRLLPSPTEQTDDR